MTLETTNRVEIWRGNGSTTTWPWNFRIDSAEHLTVSIQDYLTGEIIEILSPGSYIATGFGNDAGGVVEYPLSGNPLSDDRSIILLRTVPLTQELDISPVGGFNPEVIEQQLDSIVMQIQQVAEVQSRSLLVNPGQTPPDMSIIVGAEGFAQIAQEAAATAVASANGNLVYPRRSDAVAAMVPAEIHSISIKGDLIESDGLGGLFSDVDTGSTDTFVSGDGRTWYRVKDVSADRIADEAVTVEKIADEAVTLPKLSGETKARLGSHFQRGDLVQKKVCELFFGFNNGVTDTQIYPGAQYAAQSIAYTTVDGAEKIFIIQRPTGGETNYLATERCRIVQFPYATDGSVVTHDVFTDELNLGHGEFLYPLKIGGDLYFLTQISTVTGHEGNDSGKGIQKILWEEGDTTVGTQYQLLPYGSVTSDPLSEFGKGCWGVSSDGRVLLGRFSSTKDNGYYIIGWNLEQVLATAGGNISATVRPILGPWRLQNLGDENSAPQGVTADDQFIYVSVGFSAAFGRHAVQVYNYDGTLVSDKTVPGLAADYGLAGLLNHPTLGFPAQHEFEGICFGEGLDELLVCELDTWVSTTGTSVRSYEGQNWACIANGNSDAPYVQTSWVRTTKSAGGAWSSGGSYTTGNRTRRSKVIYRISTPREEAGETPIGDNSIFYRMPGCDFVSPGNPDQAYRFGQTFQMKAWVQALQKYLYAWFYNGRYFGIFNPDGNETDYTYLRAETDGGRSYGSAGFSIGGAINFYGPTDPSAPSTVRIFNPDNGFWQFNAGATMTLRPSSNGVGSIGTSSTRVDTINLVNAPNVSSDARLKTPVEPLTADELAAAVEIAREIGTYQLLSEVDKYGADEAWRHCGVTVQRVMAVMEARGLSPLEYKFINHNLWEAEPEEVDANGTVIVEGRPAGESYSLVYEQLWGFVIRGIVQRQDEIETRLQALEA